MRRRLICGRCIATRGATVVDLKAERLNRGLSLVDAATEMEVDRDAIRRAEEGIGRPHPRNALKIADYYGYRVTDIWPVEPVEAA